MRRWSLWVALGIAVGTASTLARGAVRWLAPRPDRRTGSERRTGGDRRSGRERRHPRSELVDRVGVSADRRSGGERRRSDERRRGEERRVSA